MCLTLREFLTRRQSRSESFSFAKHSKGKKTKIFFKISSVLFWSCPSSVTILLCVSLVFLAIKCSHRNIRFVFTISQKQANSFKKADGALSPFLRWFTVVSEPLKVDSCLEPENSKKRVFFFFFFFFLC